MPRKKSVKRSARTFQEKANEILEFIQKARAHLSEKHISWAYEYAIIRLYREFEALMLDALVGAINNDTSTLSERTGIRFPKHLTDEVCRYLIVQDGYFDFKGRNGLIKTLKRFVPKDHYLVEVVSRDDYKEALEQLSVLRNFAAHASTAAKTKAKKAVQQHRMPDAGSWLKKQNRLETIVENIKNLAHEIEKKAPY